MKTTIRTTLLVLVLSIIVSQAFGQETASILNADDFITEAQGGSTKIEAPDEITVKENILTAATMQDAANKAEELTSREYIEDEPTFMLITSKKGGIGAIASGRASYRTNATNRDSIRLAMRHAYVKAYMEAKKNLAVGMEGLTSEGKTVLDNSLRMIVTNDESLKNTETNIEELIVQRSQGFIRAYEVRRVKNIPEDSTICVTISVNGKTLGRHARPVPAMIEAVDIKTGLNQVFTEIESGITLPTGGRAIMTDKNDICYVGYGSALISYDDDPEIQAELTDSARKIATARAYDSLTGIVIGDKVTWENKLDEKHARQLKDFEDVSGNDATADQSPEGIKRFEERKRTALTRTVTGDTTQSIRKGKLPPGISPKTFRDKENIWYYAVAVYNPVLTQAASDLSAEMKDAILIQPIRKPQVPGKSSDGPALNSGVRKPSDEIRMIPTGSFDDDEEE